MRYLSPVLFHGPNAYDSAISYSRGLGRLLKEFGKDGLKIADSREVLETMESFPPGDIPGVILIGPLDLAQQMASDVLLKTLEETGSNQIRLVLWASDETDVSATIRSRCLKKWCPGPWKKDEDTLEIARELVDAALNKKRFTVISLLKEQDPRSLLEAAVFILKDKNNSALLWDSLRKVSVFRNPSATEVLAAFLLES